jgi:hypothetical protein
MFPKMLRGASPLAWAILLVLPLVVRGQGAGDPPPVRDPAPPPPPNDLPVLPPPQPVNPPPPPIQQPAPIREPDPFTNGRGPFSDLLLGVAGPPIVRAIDRVTWAPDQNVVGQGTRLGYVQNDLAVLFPIWHCGPDNVAGSVRVRSTFFSTDGTILPDTGRPFPEELWNIHVGANYSHVFANGWIAGGGLSVGSASDEPFNSVRELTVGVNGFLRIPQGQHNAWLFTLVFSPTSDTPIPIPGVAYVWQPSDNFRMNVGLPFQLMYRPIDDLTLDFSYMLLRTVHARATYRLFSDVRIYGGFDWTGENYYLADRQDRNDRFFYYEKRLSAGVRCDLTRRASLDFSTGYLFDRFYFQGHNYSDSNHDRIDVEDGPFLSAQLQLRW